MLWMSINYSIDNQATIRSMRNNTKQPAQYLIDEIYRSITTFPGRQDPRAPATERHSQHIITLHMGGRAYALNR